MKTPEEIKKGLVCCTTDDDGFADCNSCPYYLTNNPCYYAMNADALAYIQQLERERDAAVKILTDIVHSTDWFGDVDICAACKKDNCKECRFYNEGFEWRGVPEGD